MNEPTKETTVLQSLQNLLATLEDIARVLDSTNGAIVSTKLAEMRTPTPVANPLTVLDFLDALHSAAAELQGKVHLTNNKIGSLPAPLGGSQAYQR